MQYEILTAKQLKEFRESLPQQCCLCGSTEKLCLDHQHKRKTDPVGENGNGLIRGLLCTNCNHLEGKIWNNIKRYGKADDNNPLDSRIDFLNRLIDYYKNNVQHNRKIVHPTEKPVDKIAKSHYNKLVKLSSKPVNPYTGRWTKQLRELHKIWETQNDTNIQI